MLEPQLTDVDGNSQARAWVLQSTFRWTRYDTLHFQVVRRTNARSHTVNRFQTLTIIKMRLPLCCSSCVDAGLSVDDSTVLAPANNSSIYRLTCTRGHSTIVVVSEKRYEQLFEIGLCAILDDYYREAVSTFAASLERFYEFATTVFATHAGVSPIAFDKAWKTMSSQSERQLGAFVAAYLMSERVAPAILDQNAIKIRNDVVHRGSIPTREDALSFGDEVLNVIRPTLARLRTQYQQAFWQHSLDLQRATLEASELKGTKITQHSLAMALRDLDAENTEGRDAAFYLNQLEALSRRSSAAA